MLHHKLWREVENDTSVAHGTVLGTRGHQTLRLELDGVAPQRRLRKSSLFAPFAATHDGLPTHR